MQFIFIFWIQCTCRYSSLTSYLAILTGGRWVSHYTRPLSFEWFLVKVIQYCTRKIGSFKYHYRSVRTDFISMYQKEHAVPGTASIWLQINSVVCVVLYSASINSLCISLHQSDKQHNLIPFPVKSTTFDCHQNLCSDNTTFRISLLSQECQAARLTMGQQCELALAYFTYSSQVINLSLRSSMFSDFSIAH